MSKIYLYAEVLTNIRQITIHASLDSFQSEDTKIEIASDKRTITVRHNGQVASLFLPTGVAGNADITMPVKKTKDISLRLEVSDVDNIVLPDGSGSAYDYPWAAADLNPDSQLRCRQCKSRLTKSASRITWKDLPSENWAEMMDFWHCHKPHDENVEKPDESDIAGRKGYAAHSRIESHAGTGLIKISTLTLDSSDCDNIMVSLAD